MEEIFLCSQFMSPKCLVSAVPFAVETFTLCILYVDAQSPPFYLSTLPNLISLIRD